MTIETLFQAYAQTVGFGGFQSAKLQAASELK